ncbi:MAG: ABC transporter permease [Eubacteriales bacterium]
MSVNIVDGFKISVADMKRNSMRTVLTILGIVIGIAAMIAVFSVGQAGRERIQLELNNFGINRIWILPNFTSQNGEGLSMKDVEYLQTKVPGVSAVCPAGYKMQKVESKSGSEQCDIMGTNENVTQTEKTVMSEGRQISAEDVQYQRKVVVLSQKAKSQLFGDASALGKKVTIMGANFSVIGVEEEISDIYDQFFLGKCYIPISVYQNIFKDNVLTEIDVMAADSGTVDSVAEKTTQIFNKKFGEDSVKVINLSSQMKNADTIMNIFTLVLAAIAGISLLVGGIGIMNIMLVTIKERTREIGIRKALGATQRDIMWQFLFESVLYAIVGGVIGVIAGCFMTVLAAQVIGLTIRLSALPVVASVVFATVVGLVFGILPARRAARLDPVDALRQE